MSTSIDDLMNQAKEAENTQLTTQQPSNSTSNAVAVAANTAPPSLEGMMASGGLTVDLWLKVSEDGLKLENKDGKKALFESTKARIDMSEVVATKSIKYGNPVNYNKTFDGVLSQDGITPWTTIVERAGRASPAGSPYDSADIPITLTADVTDAKGAVVAAAGTRVGYSLSTTNAAAFRDFLKEIKNADLSVSSAIVDVELGYLAKTNKNNNKWGIVTFKFEGESAE